MRHTFDLTVENQPGVLAHIAGMFAARGFAIASLSLGGGADPVLSRLSVTVIGDSRVREQVRAQLEKIVTVVSVRVREAACRPRGART